MHGGPITRGLGLWGGLSDTGSFWENQAGLRRHSLVSQVSHETSRTCCGLGSEELQNGVHRPSPAKLGKAWMGSWGLVGQWDGLWAPGP